MDMSLDELIEKKMSAVGVGFGGVGQKDDIKSGVAGGISKSISNGSASVGGGPTRSSAVKRPRGFNPYNKGGASTRWTRKTHEGIENQPMKTTNIYKINISNLGTKVTSADIQEIFCEFGSLKTAAVHYDTSGKSLGTAGLEFGNEMSAINAVSKYHNVTLDGRPMKIKFTTTVLPTVTKLGERHSKPATKPIRNTHGGGIRSNWSNSVGVLDTNLGNTSERDNRGGRDSMKMVPTKEELDKQLDSFIKKQKETCNMKK